MYKDFEMHGLALILVPPALYSSLQTLSYILNPYASLYKDRMELKRNLFSNKIWYFIDMKKISDGGKNALIITYNDDEEERLNLKGIKPSHLQLLKEALQKNIYESIEKRN